MRESIVCIGRMGKEPYRFPDTGALVFSYEELCCYLRGHMLCYLYTLPEEDLLFYIRDELGLEKLYRQLSKLTDPNRDQMKYFSALFREGNYFSEYEIRQILDTYRDLKNAPYALQCKWTGDMLLNAGRAAMAVHYYKEALKPESLGKVETGAAYHNMAIAKARLFRFEDAKIDFVKAYQYAGDEESLYYYYCIIALTENIDRAKEEMDAFKISELSLESFENRFADRMDAFADSAMAEKQRKIRCLQQGEKDKEAAKIYQKLVRKMQSDFRKEIEVEEHLHKAGNLWYNAKCQVWHKYES